MNIVLIQICYAVDTNQLCIVFPLQDRREFAKFEKDRQNAKWDTVNIIIVP